MPLDLGNHPARLAPACRLVGEVRVVSPDFVWRPSDRTLEQVADPVLQDLVGGQPDRIFDPLSLQVLVDTRHGEGGIGPEIDAPDPAAIPHDDRLEHTLPAIGAVHVAGTQSAAFQIAELVEHEQRMIAGALVMAVPDAQLLLAMGRADARIHVEHDAARRPSTVHQVDPLAAQVSQWREVVSAASHFVSKRPIWLGEAAQPCAALPPTIQRIAGS